MKKILIFLLISLFMVGCGNNGNGLVDSNGSLERGVVVQYGTYSESLKTDAMGRVDMTEALAPYLGKSAKVKNIVEVKDSSGEPLSDIEVAYWVESEKNRLHLRYRDPNDELTMLYQHLSLKETNQTETQNKVRMESPILLRFLGRAVLRSLILYDTGSTIKATYDLFNVEIEYEKHEEELVFEGTVSEFYTFFDGLDNLRHLPFALSSNIVKLKKIGSAKGAIKLDNGVVRHLFTEFLKELGGYALANDDTKVKITLHKFDNEGGFFSIEVVEEQVDDGQKRELYDIIITQEGDLSHKFDHPLLDDVAPEFKGFLVVRGISYELFKGVGSYRAKERLKNVPLALGDELNIKVLDMDMTYHDDVTAMKIVFDGVGEKLQEDEFSTTKVEFVKAGTAPVTIKENYDINVTIKAIEGITYDIFGNAPDFTGTIVVSSGHFHIEMELDSFVNNKIIKDVPIEMGEKVTVKIIDKDIFFDDDMIEFDFKFDGQSVTKKNRLAEVSLDFL